MRRYRGAVPIRRRLDGDARARRREAAETAVYCDRGSSANLPARRDVAGGPHDGARAAADQKSTRTRRKRKPFRIPSTRISNTLAG